MQWALPATSLLDDGNAWRAPALHKALKETSIHPNHTVGWPVTGQGLGCEPGSVLAPAAEHQVMMAWENFVTGAPLAATAVSKLLLASWQRSLRAGVEPNTRRAPMVSGANALEHLRQRNRDLLWAAQGLFVTSAHLLASSGSVMILTDPNGVVLEVAGDQRTLDAAQDVHLVQGGHWHESVVGTNGIGTALAMRQPVQVHGAEHFGEGIKRWTCAAAPVFVPGSEQILGVIDISGPPSTYQRGNLALALAGARQMEAVLSERASREHVQLLEACMKFGAPHAQQAVLVLDRNARLIHFSGELPGHAWRMGTQLPGLQAGRQVEEWSRHLPAGLRPEWLHPVRLDGVTIGALVMVPRPSRSGLLVPAASAASTVSTPAPRSSRSESEIDPSRTGFGNLLGHSQALSAAIDRARLLSGRRVSVLIQGETGVGKELFARALHGDEARSGPFVTFNCGATSKELIGSELFGHVRGAFTGATHEGRAGRFELAHGGTLCLDEIGELSLDLQPMLLRCLEEGVIYRLGESKPRRIDVRLLSMTNRDLLHEVEAGRFRRDLYHRISVTSIRVPPLREREGDIALLTQHFNHSLAERHGVPCRLFGSQVMAALQAYAWPGNVRELRNLVESLLLTSDNASVDCSELPDALQAMQLRGVIAEGVATSSLEDAERLAIMRAMKSVHGNLAQAARALGISRSTLYRKVERYHLENIARFDEGLDGAGQTLS